MEQEFLAKRRKRALGHARALPRRDHRMADVRCSPRSFPTSWRRSCVTAGTDGARALHGALGHAGTAAI